MISMAHRMVVAAGVAASLTATPALIIPAWAETVGLIPWHLIQAPSPGPAHAIGGYAHGCLTGGVALPLDGVGYQVIRPSRHRSFGHPVLIDYVQRLGLRAHGAGLGLLNIGDMAQPRGGPLNFGHASHQIGLDVDIWLRLDLPLLPRNRRDDLKELTVVDGTALDLVRSRWTPAQVTLIRLATQDARVTRIFVNPIIKLELCRQAGADREWLRVIRPWYGHDDHFHVRLACPADSPLCEAQPPVPPGDGCDTELMSWLPEARPPVPKKAALPHPPPNPVLPAACLPLNLAATPFASVQPW